MNDERSTGIDQQTQVVSGPQTNIGGNVYGPVLSGVFNAPVYLTIQQRYPFLADYNKVFVQMLLVRSWASRCAK